MAKSNVSNTVSMQLDMAREPHYEALEPGLLWVFRDATGRLRMTIDSDRTYLDIKVARCFPFDDPDHYIGFLDGLDRVIGVVLEPEQMSVESRKTVFEELDHHYFIPTIERITSLREEFGAVYIEADTDYGHRKLVAKGLRDAVKELAEGELLIVDVDGNRFLIRDWRALDKHSRRFLERVV